MILREYWLLSQMRWHLMRRTQIAWSKDGTNCDAYRWHSEQAMHYERALMRLWKFQRKGEK